MVHLYFLHKCSMISVGYVQHCIYLTIKHNQVEDQRLPQRKHFTLALCPVQNILWTLPPKN